MPATAAGGDDAAAAVHPNGRFDTAGECGGSTGAPKNEVMVAAPVEQPATKVFLLVKQASFDEAAPILAASPHFWREVESDGYTLLHWGALAGNVAFVSDALAAGVEADAVAANGQTPLMWAVIRGHVGVAKLLLEAKANLYARDSFGATPFILAIQHQQHGAFMLLISRADREKLFAHSDDNGCGPVHWAAYKGDQTSLKLLGYFDADFTTLDSTKMTPLHRAVQSSQSGICEFLLEKEVNPALLDSQGRTCMDLAQENQDVLMQRTLSRLLEVTHAGGGSVVVEGDAGASRHDLEQGGSRSVARKRPNAEKKQMEELRLKAVHNAAATFWFVSVSLAVFQYITDIRVVCWRLAPTITLAFELGVPASLALFFITAMADPGKVPPRVKSVSGVEDHMRALGACSAREVQPDFGRLCTTTWVLKGPRTKYCTRSGACIDEFDHFCGWLNVAIGRGNHRPFIFLACAEASTQLCHLYLCWIAAGQLVKGGSTGEWLLGVAAEYPMLALMVFLHSFTAPGVVMLTLHQLRLIAVNMTTNEMMNAYRYEHFWQNVPQEGGQKRRVFKNPFHKGSVLRNCLDFWWTRRRAERGLG